MKSVLYEFEQGIEYLKHSERKLRPRTVGVSERDNQKVKRLLKPMRAFGDEQNMLATTRLIALRHNCILDRRDWLTHAINSAWYQPLLSSVAAQQQRQQQSLTTPPSTIGGTRPKTACALGCTYSSMVCRHGLGKKQNPQAEPHLPNRQEAPHDRFGRVAPPAATS